MAKPKGDAGPMANVPFIPMGEEPGGGVPPAAGPKSGSDADNHRRPKRLWQSGGALSSAPAAFGDVVERFLADAGFDRAPWLAVIFASGMLAWFALRSPAQWTASIGVCVIIASLAMGAWHGRQDRDRLRHAVVACSIVFAVGMAVIWTRSETVGAESIERPTLSRVQGFVLSRDDQPALDRLRLTMAVRDAEGAAGRKIRVNVPIGTARDALTQHDKGALAEGAVVRMRVRLMPPASPMLPGGYDFARAAWFQGLAATGSIIGPLEIVDPAPQASGLANLQRTLSTHVRSRVEGAPGTIAAAFASGDRGAISESDASAMRDAGLTHLLAISGLHVSAVIAAAYFVTIKLLSLWPTLALNIRLPVIAASVGALAGIGYTLLTGAQVPTVRSCAAAMLVLIAMAMGRDALSLRMVAIAAIFVLLLWPESVVGPSFQMSFSAVLAIVALHTSKPVKAFFAAREEPFYRRIGRNIAMLFLTGLIIEIALMPVVMFHFHRAGVYGAFANMFAIPLVTFVSMPMIAAGLVFDAVGLGAPMWWVVERSLEILLALAHLTAAQPGAVTLMPQMSWLAIAMFVVGSQWLALWNGPARAWGGIPILAGMAMVFVTPIPDILIGREGRHVGISVEGEDGEGRRLISLRTSRSTYSRDNLLELASVRADPIPLSQWPGARCSPEFCTMVLVRGGRAWSLLLSRNRVFVDEHVLADACRRADIVVADRYLPQSCQPRWLKADRDLLSRTGGLAINLDEGSVTSVADNQGEHGWWRGVRD